MTESRKFRVLICHATQDKPLMQEMFDRLEAEKWIEPWMADESLMPGMNWDVEVEKAVISADVIIICISRNAIVDNKYVPREMSRVLDMALNKTNHSSIIIPMLLDDCQIPCHIQPWQYFDFSVLEQREETYQRLVKNLRMRADMVDPQITAQKKSAHFISPRYTSRTISTFEALKDFEFIEIPRGKFLMGSKVSNPLALGNEIPRHPCHIPYDYQISRFPVTNEHFGEFGVANSRTDVLVRDWRNKLNHPAVNVTWHNAVTYVHWLNKVYGKELDDGLVFRLPTEAEWERAARGDFGSEYPWGNESLDELLEKELTYNMQTSVSDVGPGDFSVSSDVTDFYAKVFHFDRTEIQHVDVTVRPSSYVRWKFKPKFNYLELKKGIQVLRGVPVNGNVGSFSPITDSPYKAGDMMGTIAEWTQSLYAPYPYNDEDGRESLGGDEKRVVRGFFATPNERFSVRSARRFGLDPNIKAIHLGFRIVIAPPTPS